jgi:hypothetical protein
VARRAVDAHAEKEIASADRVLGHRKPRANNSRSRSGPRTCCIPISPLQIPDKPANNASVPPAPHASQYTIPIAVAPSAGAGIPKCQRLSSDNRSPRFRLTIVPER